MEEGTRRRGGEQSISRLRTQPASLIHPRDVFSSSPPFFRDRPPMILPSPPSRFQTRPKSRLPSPSATNVAGTRGWAPWLPFGPPPKRYRFLVGDAPISSIRPRATTFLLHDPRIFPRLQERLADVRSRSRFRECPCVFLSERFYLTGRILRMMKPVNDTISV